LACALLLAACGGQAAATGGVALSGGSPDPIRAPVVLSSAAASGDWTRFDYDAQRSGVGPADTGITAVDLGRLRRRTVSLDGTVDSAPIEFQRIRVRGRIRDVIVVTTTYGRTIAIDALTGGRLWEYTPPGIGGFEGSAQVTTATPVADPDRRYVYAASPDGRIRKLILATGNEVRAGGWPAVITRDASKEKIAGALNLAGRYVIAVTGGYLGDAPTYQGHVAMIDRGSGRLLHVFNTLCSNRRQLIVPSSCGESDSAIWARAGAVVEPNSGRLLVATGNAAFNGATNWGDSVLELSPDATLLLHNWTPVDQANLSANDTDVGSTAPALLPVTGGRRLAVQGGKDGKLHLLDLDRLNGTAGGPSRRLGGELQLLSAPGGSQVLTAPAVWTNSGRTYVFVANDSGTAAYVLDGGRRPRLSVVWQHATAGTSPVLAGGLLYVYDDADGQLIVRQPSSGNTLISLDVSGGHWNSPIVLGGRIVVPVGAYGAHATSGTLYIYHLPGR
jgi:outer membrane protein assembly factor BamB